MFCKVISILFSKKLYRIVIVNKNILKEMFLNIYYDIIEYIKDMANKYFVYVNYYIL